MCLFMPGQALDAECSEQAEGMPSSALAICSPQDTASFQGTGKHRALCFWLSAGDKGRWQPQSQDLKALIQTLLCCLFWVTCKATRSLFSESGLEVAETW